MRDCFLERFMEVFKIGAVHVANLGLIYFPACILFLCLFFETRSGYAVVVGIKLQIVLP
jgi:hypothetical protein